MNEPSDRKLAALRAMANQNDSPAERDIAREKLRRLASLQARVMSREEQEAARIAAAIKADEDARAELVRRWARGDFAGVTLRAGSVVSARHRKTVR